MGELYYKPKIENAFSFKKKLEASGNANHGDQDASILIPHGLQLKAFFKVPKQIRCVLTAHNNNASTETFIAQYGTGPSQLLKTWNGNQGTYKKGVEKQLDCQMKKLIHISQHRCFVAFFNDMSLRTYGLQLQEYSTQILESSILDAMFINRTDTLVGCGIDQLKAWKVTSCNNKPPTFIASATLPRIMGQRPWVNKMHHDSHTKELFVLCVHGVFILDDVSFQLMAILPNRHPIALTSVETYHLRHHIITGGKDGTIKAWSTQMNSFPLIDDFCGHTRSITCLKILQSDGLLISASEDRTIRFWRLDNFHESYCLNTMEPILCLDVTHSNHLYYASNESIKVWDLNLFHSQFSVVGATQLRLARSFANGISRIVLRSQDGSVRIVSPIHGQILTTLFPSINSTIKDVVHDVKLGLLFLLLESYEVMVFSALTNPCRLLQIWSSETMDDRVASICLVPTRYLTTGEKTNQGDQLLFAGHLNGCLSIIGGEDLKIYHHKCHQGAILNITIGMESNNETTMNYILTIGADQSIGIWRLSTRANLVYVTAIARMEGIDQPSCIATVGIVTALSKRNILEMYRLQIKKKNVNQMYTLVKIPQSSDEKHAGDIIQVSGSNTLKIFVTSSFDHRVKIWSDCNVLLKELCFDNTLDGVCFANDRGDLLIGYQRNLHHISALRYLPKDIQIYMKNNVQIVDEVVEYSVAFETGRDILYDMNDALCVDFQEVTSLDLNCLQEAKQENIEENVQLKKMMSRPSTKAKDRLQCKQSDEASIKHPDEEAAKQIYQEKFKKQRKKKRRQSNARSLTKQKLSQSFLNRENTEVESIDSNVESIKDGIGIKQNPIEKDKMKENPKPERKYWPFAPDGYIPNSIIRSLLIGLPEIKRPQIVYKPRKQNQIQKTKSDSVPGDAERGCTIVSPSKSPGSRVITWSSSEESLGDFDISQMFQSKEKEKTTEIKREEKIIPPKKPANGSDLKRKLQATRQSRQITQSSSLATASENTPESQQARKQTKKVKKREKGKSLLEETKEEENEDGNDTVENLPDVFKRLMQEKWFPKETEMTIDDVTMILINILEKSNPNIIKSCCSYFADIHRDIVFPNILHEAVVTSLLNLLEHPSAIARHASLKALVALGMARDDVVLALARALLDTTESVRSIARDGLAQLAGIQDIENLMEYLQNIGAMRSYELVMDTSMSPEEIRSFRGRSENEAGERQTMVASWIMQLKSSQADVERVVNEVDDDEGDLLEIEDDEFATKSRIPEHDGGNQSKTRQKKGEGHKKRKEKPVDDKTHSTVHHSSDHVEAKQMKIKRKRKEKKKKLIEQVENNDNDVNNGKLFPDIPLLPRHQGSTASAAVGDNEFETMQTTMNNSSRRGSLKMTAPHLYQRYRRESIMHQDGIDKNQFAEEVGYHFDGKIAHNVPHDCSPTTQRHADTIQVDADGKGRSNEIGKQKNTTQLNGESKEIRKGEKLSKKLEEQSEVVDLEAEARQKNLDRLAQLMEEMNTINARNTDSNLNKLKLDDEFPKEEEWSEEDHTTQAQGTLEKGDSIGTEHRKKGSPIQRERMGALQSLENSKPRRQRAQRHLKDIHPKRTQRSLRKTFHTKEKDEKLKNLYTKQKPQSIDIRNVFISTITKALAMRLKQPDWSKIDVDVNTLKDMTTLLNFVTKDGRQKDSVDLAARPILIDLNQQLDDRKTKEDAKDNELEKKKSGKEKLPSLFSNRQPRPNAKLPYCERQLIPMDLGFNLVPGVTGERIAKSLHFEIETNEDSTYVRPIPERLGNHPLSRVNGRCCYGAFDIEWTSRTVPHDADLAAMQDARLVSYRKQKLPPLQRIDSGKNDQDVCKLHPNLLTSLFKCRLQKAHRKYPFNQNYLTKTSKYESTLNPQMILDQCVATRPPPPPNTAEVPRE